MLPKFVWRSCAGNRHWAEAAGCVGVVAHVHVLVLREWSKCWSMLQAKMQELCRVIKCVWLVFGLETQPHLFQMFSVVFIANSYCAALGGKKKSNWGVPIQHLHAGKSSINGAEGFNEEPELSG